MHFTLVGVKISPIQRKVYTVRRRTGNEAVLPVYHEWTVWFGLGDGTILPASQRADARAREREWAMASAKHPNYNWQGDHPLWVGGFLWKGGSVAE